MIRLAMSSRDAARVLGFLAVLAAVPGGAAGRPGSPGDWVMSAMTQEMDRSRQRLRLEGYDAPYFLAYTVRDLDRHYVAGKAGAVFQSQSTRTRNASVDVRVGSYDMDSSEDADAFFNPRQKWTPNSVAPVDASIPALRTVLWLLTDYRYKAALMSYLQVKAREVNDPKAREAGSMTREDPLVLVEEAPPWSFDRKRWEGVVRQVGAIATGYPEIFDSSVEVAATRLTRWMVTSEGVRVRTVDDYVQVMVVAVTRAEDGMLLQDTATWYGRSTAELPDPKEVESQARDLLERLRRLRTAPVLEPTSVPVWMYPEATGVFFHETVGHRLEGQRQSGEEEGRTFKGQVGQRILPDFVDIVDDPLLQAQAGVSLNGYYRVDDEGVHARPAVLVERGILKGFLMSRRPLPGFDRSNGHGRSDGFQPAVGRMANLVIRGTSPVPHSRMKELLLEEVRRQGKPFGLIVQGIAGGATNTSSYGFQAFKGVPRIAWRVDAETGEESLVRGFEIVGTPLASINKVLATSDRYGVFNGYCGAESGMVPVSTVAPDMIFAEIEIQRAQEAAERPPILPPPWSSQERAP
ncbi:TldD/PmbA family protein [Myxococcota bacterium]|nr:TldD/PmbA family protein [Myxococcota bacterium]